MSFSEHALPFTTRLLYAVEVITLEEYQETLAGQHKTTEKSESKKIKAPSLELKPHSTLIMR